MNNKLQVKLFAAIAAVAGFVEWMATLTPAEQDSVTGPIVAIIPLTWRPEVGLIMKAVVSVAGFWALYKAAHTGASDPDVPATTAPPALPKITALGAPAEQPPPATQLPKNP